LPGWGRTLLESLLGYGVNMEASGIAILDRVFS
jgi:hypothetical protein